MKEKYVKMTDITRAIWAGIILSEVPSSFIERIKNLPSILLEEPEEISIEHAKKFADYYRNDVLNRDTRTIDEHFILFSNK